MWRQVFRVGDIVKFQCSTGYMMSGSPVAACTHTRAWSRPAPACVTACTYPGTAQGGLIDKVTVDIYEDIYYSIYSRPIEAIFDKASTIDSSYSHL